MPSGLLFCSRDLLRGNDMEITHKWWDANIQPRLSEKPNLLLESDLIEFAVKALDQVEDLQSRIRNFITAARSVLLGWE